MQQDLQTLQTDAAALQATVASLEQKITGIQPKAPAQLQSRLSDLQGRLAQLDKRLTGLQRQVTAVLKDPSQANIIKLDPTLASLQSRVTNLLNRQAVQHPGELVVMKSSQLSGLQDLVSALRNLGFVLPLLALVLYLAALYLAKGWRRRGVDGGRGRDPGGHAARPAGEAPARQRGHRLGGELRCGQTGHHRRLGHHFRRAARAGAVRTRDRAGFHRWGALAGPGRHEVAVRRFLAPYLRDRPVVVYAVLAFVFLLWLAFLPTINNVGQVLVIVILAVLAVVGIEILRRQTAREFPPTPAAPGQTQRP